MAGLASFHSQILAGHGLWESFNGRHDPRASGGSKELSQVSGESSYFKFSIPTDASGLNICRTSGRNGKEMQYVSIIFAQFIGKTKEKPCT